MANIDVTYKGLTGVEVVLTVANTLTIDGLISAIATSEGLPTDYYKVSLGGSPDKNEVSYGDSSATIASMGFVTGSRAICSPNQDGTKQSRMIQKLEIAQEKRQANGDTTKRYYRANNTYDLSFLPDTYATSGDDNANPSGLVQGRPWYDPNTEATYNGEVIEVSPGIWRTNYQNYYFESGTFFDTAALKTGGAAYNGPTSDISIPDLPEYTSIMLKGYMKVTYTGTYTFYVNCDDGAYMWFGDNAIDNWKNPSGVLINYNINNGGEHGIQEVAGTVNLTAGNYIPLRVAFGNNGGPGVLIVSYSHPGQAKTSDFTGKIFYRTTTNGF